MPLFQSILPISGLSALVSDGVDGQLGVGVSIDHRVRKAVAQAAACAIRIRRPRVWKLDNSVDRSENFLREAFAKSLFAFTVKLGRRREFAFRFWMN